MHFIVSINSKEVITAPLYSGILGRKIHLSILHKSTLFCSHKYIICFSSSITNIHVTKRLLLKMKVKWKTIIMTLMGMSQMIQNCNTDVERVTNIYYCQKLSFHFPYYHLNHFVSRKSNKVYLSMSNVLNNYVLWWHADISFMNQIQYLLRYMMSPLYNLQF